MEPRGNLIRIPVILLAACLVAGSLAFSANGASHHPVATASKKCKKKHHGRKHHGKKRKCKPTPAPMPTPASISISPTSQDFGMQSLGTTTRTFTITNVGGSPGGVPVPKIAGPNAVSFTVGANTCTNVLPPAISCQIDVKFRFAGSSGPQSGTLNVTAVPGGMVSAAMTGDFEA